MARTEVGSLSGVEVVRENTRTGLAYILLGAYLVFLAVLIIVGWLFLGLQVDDITKMVSLTAGVMGGIVGAVVGFYFGK